MSEKKKKKENNQNNQITNCRLAVKAFIVHKNKLLIVKRAEDEVHMPNIWELPGGRLSPGEDPFIGIIREIREETGLYIKPILPMAVKYFKRQDGQTVTMIISFCKPIGGHMEISEEHSEMKWVDLKQAKEDLPKFFHKDVDYYYRFKLGKIK